MFKSMVVAGLLFVSAIGNAGNKEVRLNTANTITLRGEVTGESVLATMKSLSALDNKRGLSLYPLFLVIDSPGGSIDAGEDLIQYAKTIRNLHTVTIFAASMGSAIVQGLPGRRLMAENGVQMFHRARIGLSGQIGDGELESRLDFYKKLVTELEVRNSSRMGMKLVDYRKRVKDEMWLTSKDSMQEHAADSIVDIKCSEELVAQEHKMEIQVFIFSVTLKFSGCPLFRTPEVIMPKPEGANKQLVLQGLQEYFSPGVLK